MSHATLLEPQDLAELGPNEAPRLPLDLVDPNPQNPRRELVEVDALADNIREFSLLQPITVRRNSERYEVLGGHRRLAAFNLLREREPHADQWRTIPAVVRSTDQDRGYLMLISGQVHVRNWKPREEAAALERLVLAGRTTTEVGQALHKTTSWASKRLRVYSDAVLSGYVQSGKLPTTVAEELLPVLDVNVRKEMADLAAKEDWSQDFTRGQVRGLRLDTQLRMISRTAKAMLEVLSTIQADQLPLGSAKNLWQLKNRIEMLATGRKPIFPTLEAAQKAARVNPEKPTRRGRTRLKID